VKQNWIWVVKGACTSLATLFSAISEKSRRLYTFFSNDSAVEIEAMVVLYSLRAAFAHSTNSQGSARLKLTGKRD